MFGRLSKILSDRERFSMLSRRISISTIMNTYRKLTIDIAHSQLRYDAIYAPIYRHQPIRSHQPYWLELTTGYHFDEFSSLPDWTGSCHDAVRGQRQKFRQNGDHQMIKSYNFIKAYIYGGLRSNQHSKNILPLFIHFEQYFINT